MTTIFLADTSVVTRRRMPDVKPLFSALVIEGVLAVCGTIELELCRGASNRQDLDAFRALCAVLRRAPITDATLDRACDVQALLANDGRHRLPPADLIIAAAAEQAGMTVLHYDSDFERIAEVTGQPHRWIAPRGSL